MAERTSLLHRSTIHGPKKLYMIGLKSLFDILFFSVVQSTHAEEKKYKISGADAIYLLSV
jgi:hypothetical protein